MRRMMLMLAIVMAAGSAEALCNTVRLQVNGVSRHYNSDYATYNGERRTVKYNEANTGAGVVCDMGDGWTFQLGEVQNSYYRDSVYFGVADQFRLAGDSKGWNLSAGPYLGLHTGYADGIDCRQVEGACETEWIFEKVVSVAGVTPVVAAVVSLSYSNKVKVNFLYMPYKGVFGKGADAVALNAEFSPITW